MSVEGTMPVITALISAYSTATIPSDPMIPTGSALPVRKSKVSVLILVSRIEKGIVTGYSSVPLHLGIVVV
jgi:hypothetical protein